MKKLTLASVIFGSLTISTTASANSPTEQMIDLAEIWASSTIDGYTIGQRVLDLVIFSSSGPDYVRLHQDSLDEIDQIVNNALFDLEVRDMQSTSRTFRHNVEDYHASHVNGSGSNSEIADLASYGMSLIEHPAYQVGSNGKAHLLTASFASDAALVAAVYGEAIAIGRFPPEHGRARTALLASMLEQLGSATSQYTHLNVVVHDAPFHCSGVGADSTPFLQADESTFEQTLFRDCVFTVHDAIVGRTTAFEVSALGYEGAAGLAYNQQLAWIIENQNSIRGSKYQIVLDKLHAIANSD